MAINQNDDYEQLAKLIYPSFEASGNVYYGQTRKLTLDEVLKKNDLGFESYTSSAFNNKYFCWKLGPLHDSFETSFDYTFGVHVIAKDVSTHTITVDAFNTVCQIIDDQDGNLSYDNLQINQKLYGTFWAKYIIHTNNKTVDNILDSGDYKTYEKDISIELSNIVCTYYTSPIDDTFVNDRNFIVDNNTSCIYIKICNSTDSADDEYIEPEYTAEQLVEPVTISVKSGTVDISLTRVNTSNELYYKKNNGELLLISRAHTRTVSLVSGDKLYLSGKHYGTSSISGDFNISTIVASDDCEIELYGNINALLDKDNTIGVLNVPAYAFAYLFSQFNADFDSSALILPAKLLNEGCYSSMFNYSNMIKAPENLPAEDIPSYCYKDMFSACYKLTTVPKIPHLNSLQYESFSSMFGGCTSLVKAYDKIEFTSSSTSIYSFMGMFSACTSIEAAPKLPSEPIGTCIYAYMFANCTSLKSAPKLSTISNTNSIAPYQGMFNGCTSLQFVACNADSTFNIIGGFNWLNNVSSTGVFYKNDNNNSWTSGPSGIPEGWTIKNWSELPADPVNGFNIQYLPDPEYTNKVLLTSGVDSSDNGRGTLDTGTVYNMSTLFDEDNKHQINTCNKSSGSYNQDVWGYKTFNSPVKFRNGIYGETASLIATTVDNKNVTKLSLYDCTLNGNDAGLVNNPYIQIGYTVDSESNKSESAIELKANKIVIDGTLETSGSSRGVIPFIPATKGPTDAISSPYEPDVGELLHVVAYCTNGVNVNRWDNCSDYWEYRGFPTGINDTIRFYYNKSNVSNSCKYAKVNTLTPGYNNVTYSSSINGPWSSWPLSGTGDGSNVRYGKWECYRTLERPAAMEGATIYINTFVNRWASNEYVEYYVSSTYDNVYTKDSSGKIDDGYDPSTDADAGSWGDNNGDVGYDLKMPSYYATNAEQTYMVNDNSPWIDVTPSSYNNVYYNANNSIWKIYNDNTGHYIDATGCDDFNVILDNEGDGYENIINTSGDSPYSSSDANWKPFGIFHNQTNDLFNSYCFNGNIEDTNVLYYSKDTSATNYRIYKTGYQELANDVLENNRPVGAQYDTRSSDNMVRANIHYGAVFTYDSINSTWKLGDYNINLYNIKFTMDRRSTTESYPCSLMFTSYSVNPIGPTDFKIAALSSAQTAASLPLTYVQEGENMFYAQRIK